MEWRDWFNYGLPTAMLAVLIYGLIRCLKQLWELAVWTRENVVVPVVKAHLALMETLTNTVPRLEEKQDKSIEIQGKIAAKQVKQMEEIKEILQSQTDSITVAINSQTQVIEETGKKK